MFITFEGNDGAGKSTQSKLLIEELEKSGREVLATREPGGIREAELVRELLLREDTDLLPETELLLHLAARKEHYVKVIKPALKNGKIVVCDRFFDSTLAYQGYGHSLGKQFVNNVSNLVIGDIRPDLTIFLKISQSESEKRLSDRQDENNRYESMAESFHERVRKGFDEIAKNEPLRFLVINADKSVDEVHDEIIKKLQVT